MSETCTHLVGAHHICSEEDEITLGPKKTPVTGGGWVIELDIVDKDKNKILTRAADEYKMTSRGFGFFLSMRLLYSSLEATPRR